MRNSPQSAYIDKSADYTQYFYNQHLHKSQSNVKKLYGWKWEGDVKEVIDFKLALKVVILNF